MISLTDWQETLVRVGVREATAARWAQAFADEVQPEKFSAGLDDLRCWLPQLLHEYELLEHTEERLSYTAERLCVVWPGRFPTLASAAPYVHAPQKLANLVYGGRMGNVERDDGWRYRGRPMITGRWMYAKVGEAIGQNLLDLPDLIQQPHYALQAAIAWWEGEVPDAILGDQTRIRRRVQGGTLGLEHCAQLLERTDAALGVLA